MVRVDGVEYRRGELPAPLTLALAVLDTRAFDWAVEKATELGVTRVVPVLCERVQRRDPARRLERWRRIAEAALAQCGRSRLPEIPVPRKLGPVMEGTSGARLVASPGAGSVTPIVGAEEGITVLVGPEGGFTDGELAAIEAARFVPMGLGNRTLRAETAAIAALVAAQLRAGWLC